jgi:uncharacterized protein (TIGR02145 family)
MRLITKPSPPAQRVAAPLLYFFYATIMLAAFITLASLNKPEPVQKVKSKHSLCYQPDFDTESPYNEDSSTHLWIVRRGFMLAKMQGAEGNLIYNLFRPDSIVNGYKYKITNVFQNGLCRGLYDADFSTVYNNPAIGDHIATYCSHFYDPDTHKNWLGDDDPTALSMGTALWHQSLDSYAEGKLDSAGYYLGVALHYLTDLGQPMHAANFTAIDEPHKGFFFSTTDNWHLNFEKYVMDSQKLARPVLTKYTEWDGINEIPEDIYISLAQRSKQLYKDYGVGPSIVCLGKYNKEFVDSCERGKGQEPVYRNNVMNRVVNNVKGILDPMLQNAIESVSQLVVAWAEEAMGLVELNEQLWTSHNLDVSTYRDGTPIPQVQDSATWTKLTTGAWCWITSPDDPTGEKYGHIYGKLYNWYAVDDPRGLAPVGYHITTDREWAYLNYQLFQQYGNNQGGVLKSKEFWFAPNAGANNLTGFRALPGGFRHEDGRFLFVGYACNIWTSTSELRALTAYSWNLTSGDGKLYHQNDFGKGSGLSVRCIKD